MKNIVVAFSALFSFSTLALGNESAQTSQVLVSTAPSSLLSFSAIELEVNNFEEMMNPGTEGLKEFLACFVSGMDLPSEVYMDCGKAILGTALKCVDSVVALGCVTSVIDMGQKCYLPASKAIDVAKACSKNPTIETPVLVAPIQ
jgi:hypothetical protein